MIIFSGSRRLDVSHKPYVQEIVKQILDAGVQVGVGCASGLDSFVRNTKGFSSQGQVFKVSGNTPSAYAQRSIKMVSTANHTRCASLLFWPQGSCPAGLLPNMSSSKCFCGKGSGTWATAAFAAGLGMSVYVFGMSKLSLPSSWGVWSKTNLYKGGFKLVPKSSFGPQLNLFQ